MAPLLGQRDFNRFFLWRVLAVKQFSQRNTLIQLGTLFAKCFLPYLLNTVRTSDLNKTQEYEETCPFYASISYFSPLSSVVPYCVNLGTIFEQLTCFAFLNPPSTQQVPDKYLFYQLSFPNKYSHRQTMTDHVTYSTKKSNIVTWSTLNDRNLTQDL